MGKAARKKRQEQDKSAPTRAAAPYAARPFAGLAGETDMVAMREIVPAATARLALGEGIAPPGAPSEVTLCTILPMAWPALRRADGEVLVALQTVQAGGDASRDVAQALLAALECDPGTPVGALPPVTTQTPRLQDLLAPGELDVQVHDDFDFWVAPDVELDEAAKASLADANASIVPTTKLGGVPSAYWCRIGERTHVRWILPHEEDAATDALARLHAAGEDLLGEGTRLLGAFRAGGLLCPVWDLDPAKEAADYEEPMAALAERFDAALTEEALTPEQRRAKSGLLSRQLTLR